VSLIDKTLKEVEDAIFSATGSAVLSGERWKAGDRYAIYKSLCVAGNNVVYARSLLSARTRDALRRVIVGIDYDGHRDDIMIGFSQPKRALLWAAEAVAGHSRGSNRPVVDGLTESLERLGHLFYARIGEDRSVSLRWVDMHGPVPGPAPRKPSGSR